MLRGSEDLGKTYVVNNEAFLLLNISDGGRDRNVVRKLVEITVRSLNITFTYFERTITFIDHRNVQFLTFLHGIYTCVTVFHTM